jgi:hypothetical protein
MRHHVRQRRRLRELEEDEQGPFHEGDQGDLHQRQTAERQRHRDAPKRQGTAAVGDQHHPLAVPAVDQGAGGQEQQQERQGLSGAHDPRLGRRAGERETSSG